MGNNITDEVAFTFQFRKEADESDSAPYGHTAQVHLVLKRTDAPDANTFLDKTFTIRCNTPPKPQLIYRSADDTIRASANEPITYYSLDVSTEGQEKHVVVAGRPLFVGNMELPMPLWTGEGGPDAGIDEKTIAEIFDHNTNTSHAWFGMEEIRPTSGSRTIQLMVKDRAGVESDTVVQTGTYIYKGPKLKEVKIKRIYELTGKTNVTTEETVTIDEDTKTITCELPCWYRSGIINPTGVVTPNISVQIALEGGSVVAVHQFGNETDSYNEYYTTSSPGTPPSINWESYTDGSFKIITMPTESRETEPENLTTYTLNVKAKPFGPTDAVIKMIHYDDSEDNPLWTADTKMYYSGDYTDGKAFYVGEANDTVVSVSNVAYIKLITAPDATWSVNGFDNTSIATVKDTASSTAAFTVYDVGELFNNRCIPPTIYTEQNGLCAVSFQSPQTSKSPFSVQLLNDIPYILVYEKIGGSTVRTKYDANEIKSDWLVSMPHTVTIDINKMETSTADVILYFYFDPETWTAQVNVEDENPPQGWPKTKKNTESEEYTNLRSGLLSSENELTRIITFKKLDESETITGYFKIKKI